ncbi:glycoside hydrolase family 43 protein [Cellvibrio polysaccharolyticus]|uniref:Glycosyl hydrolase n=1 Tax=Cellvibrio polysaccharolyticus TaxID=2082724 RepID=A0A928V4I6_9GAMM|nr:glycoside hydrolase family 43 protein [Cellvibrio polysaccharolyticus]MBE8717065.1 glycosyl hydrolase [Cellvibrio polysaccharolyticus]
MPFYSRIFRRILCVAMAAFLVASCVSNKSKTESKNGYIFTYFTKNGEDGLHLAASRDGYNWQKIERPKDFWLPKIGNSKLMRDPSVVKGPDGTYHMVWTSGWNENNIGYASTKDFISWSEQQEIPVMAHEPTVRNSWAPEVVYDEKIGNFVIFWSSTIPGRFPETDGASEEGYNHRLYYTTTKDFKTFTPTALFYNPGFSVIDATFLTFNDQLYLIVKDETRFPPKKYLQIAVAHSKTGPFEKLSDPITPEGFWVEGPTAVQIGDAAIIYYDAYMTRRYGALRSTDMKTWEDISEQMHFPDENTPIRMRHGTVIEASKSILEKLGLNGSR